MKPTIRIVLCSVLLLSPAVAILFTQVSWFAGAMAAAGAIMVVTLVAVTVHRLAEDNEALQLRAGEVDRVKRDFVSHVSHELKAPLASMQETTHLLLERIPGGLTDKQERLLKLNFQSGIRLSRMIGNLLDLSRLEAGVVDYDMQLENVGDLLQRVIHDLDGPAHEKGIRILTDISDEPLIAMCDSTRMVQIFQNLLDNAVRFSSRNGFVSVHAGVVQNPPRQVANEESANGYLMITISDSGPGIEDFHKEKIFETFHQVKQGKKTLGQSLGLGLAICRAVVQAHRGAIWVEDNPDGGSVFFVLLPRGKASASALAYAS